MPIAQTRTIALIFTVWLLLLATSASLAGDLPRTWRAGEVQAPGLHKKSSTTDTLPGSNNVVEIIYSGGDVWAATAKGPSRLTLPGNLWTTYGTSDGLPKLEIPSLGIFPNGVWAATSHTEAREGGVVTWGDGLYRFNSVTEEWEARTPAGDQASGPFQLIYDLAYFRGRTVAACFAGGLVISADDGQSWTNMFADASARTDFENKVYDDLNNRYFSVIVDTTRPESLAVWAGTAYGLNKFIFLNDTLKPSGYVFNDLHLDGARLYAATEAGLSVSPDRGGTWRSFNSTIDGFPSDNVISTAAKGDTIWAGFVDEDGTDGLGLAYSYNNGATWTVTEPFQAMGVNNRPVEIALTRGKVWVACEDGGMIQSGLATIDWEQVNIIASYSLLPVPPDSAETIYVGTSAGVYAWPLDGPPFPANTTPVGTDADSLGQRVIALGYQRTPCTTFASAIWALCEDNGAGRYPGYALSYDSGKTWEVSSRRIGAADVIFEGCRFWLASDSGLAEGDINNLDSLMFTASYASLVSNDYLGAHPKSLGAEIGKDALSGADVLNSLWVGTDSLLARSLDKGIKWAIVFSNPDPNEHDLLGFFRYRDEDTSNAEFEQLSGNFITALGYQPGGRGSIWAATQATGQGRSASTFIGSGEKDGLSVTRNAGESWSVPLTGHQIWNFAFDNAIVWAASSQGLLRSPDNGFTWDTLNYFADPESGAVIDSNTEVFSVEIVENEVWVGTENGFATLDRNGNILSVRRTFKPVQTTAPGGEGGAYVTPVPFSPNITAGGIRFHYIPPTDGPVTIKVYDYANNLVKTVTDGAARDAGRQYDETDVWDGRNGDGDVVAVGTYFFVIEYSGGETHWGKLVVIP